MKVRCKGIWAGSEWTVIEASPNFYIAKCNTAAGTASLPKADYEPVQEWKDMTGVYGGITVNVPGLEDREFKLEITTNGYRLFERREA